MKRYYSIDFQAMIDMGISPTQWMLLEDIHFRCNVDEWTHKNSLSEDHKISRATLYRHLENMVKLGFVSTAKKGYVKTTKKYVKMLSHNETNNTTKMSQVETKNVSKGDNPYYNKKELDRESTNTPLRFVYLSPNFSSKKDTQAHKPRQVCQTLEDDIKDELDNDKFLSEVISKFVSYRDEMYTDTKDKKYAIRTYRSIEKFVNEVASFGDVDRAFQIMEENEWATFKTEWIKK